MVKSAILFHSWFCGSRTQEGLSRMVHLCFSSRLESSLPSLNAAWLLSLHVVSYPPGLPHLVQASHSRMMSGNCTSGKLAVGLQELRWNLLGKLWESHLELGHCHSCCILLVRELTNQLKFKGREPRPYLSIENSQGMFGHLYPATIAISKMLINLHSHQQCKTLSPCPLCTVKHWCQCGNWK